MVERPSWLKVVTGGKSEDRPNTKPEAAPLDKPKPVIADESDDLIAPEDIVFGLEGDWEQVGGVEKPKDPVEKVKTSELVALYQSLSRNPPANFASRVRAERVPEHAKVVASWTMDSLYNYLAGAEVWQQPSFTQAVFEEVQLRMLRGNMSPRE